MRILRRRLRGSYTKCLDKSLLFNLPVARLGDAIVNLLASAALTLAEERPRGVKVSDKLLDVVYRDTLYHVVGPVPRGYRGADAVEALYGCLWLYGCLDIEGEIRFLAECLGREDLEHCMAASVARILGELGVHAKK